MQIALLSFSQEGAGMTDWQASRGNNHKSMQYADRNETDFLILETPYTASWQLHITEETISGTRTTAAGQQQSVRLHRIHKK